LSEPKTHFEVHGKQSGSWTVQKVCDSKEVAIDFAKILKSGQNIASVKVLQVKFDSNDPVFHDKEVYFDGERDKPNTDSGVELIEPICQSASEIYQPSARRAIGQLLQKPMAQWHITPLELLYHSKHLQKLNDTGQILQGAVQRVAISQVQRTGQKVNDRVLELYRITNEVLKNLKDFNSLDIVPEIEDDNLVKLMRAVKDHEDWRQLFLMSMARYLSDIKTIDDKFDIIMNWLGKYDDPGVLEMLDRHVADFLSSSSYLRRILGEEENLGEAMLALVDLIRGTRQFPGGSHSGGVRVNALLRDQFLPETRMALTLKLKKTLKGNASFVSGDPFKSAIYHSKLMSRTQIGNDEHVGGQEVVEALRMRSEKMTGSTTIGNMLAGHDNPLDRADVLLMISQGLVGAVSKRTIANYLLPLLESGQNFQYLTSGKIPPLTILARLQELQSKVAKSDFQEFYNTKLSERLDQMSVDLMKELEVLENFKKRAADNTQLGLTLLQLLASDKLTKPEGARMVHEFTRKTIVSADFMADLEKKAKTGASQVEFFKTFYTALEKTNIR
jgi:hypothetical protein